MLFLLKDHEGRALLMAQTASKAEADRFGRTHLPDFCGDSIEIDIASRAEAEEFWGVRTVRLVSVRLDPEASISKPATAVLDRPAAHRVRPLSIIWIRRPRLPKEVEESGLLTQEDYRDLTLDHITRTSDLVGRIEIFKRA